MVHFLSTERYRVIYQSDHCPGNQGEVRESEKVEMVRENSGNLRKREESQGKMTENERPKNWPPCI